MTRGWTQYAAARQKASKMAFIAATRQRRCSAHVAGVTQRKAPRLRPDREPVRLGPHLDLRDAAVCGVEAINDVVVTCRQPQPLAVGADVAHVRAAAAGHGPARYHLLGGEVDHSDTAVAQARAVDLVRAAVGHVELAAVAAGVQAMRAQAG